MFKANQLFAIETNVLYDLILNKGMFTYVIKISTKIFPLSYLFVDICLQDWSHLCADIVFTHEDLPLQSKKNWYFSTNSRCAKMEQRKAKDHYKTFRVLTKGNLQRRITSHMTI